MTSASLETFKAQNMEGRIFLDMLRMATTKHKDEFHTASFGEVVKRFLKHPQECLPPAAVASLSSPIL